ncbi:DNA damage-regulated autophagy modulator protein 2 [Anabarilius grahami]|uniref:DNA damage-regulated autophagy modulator protein 2 n=1 Tax=Anabarilius grahami TaxID=495550 RepID=A0A3N0XKA4_ANAGA|nr:DNA damage-regulated autophagy modulator protein 2 [Anabarilius grahami]
MWWFQRGLCALPVALVIWSSATFLISYATAVVLGHADLFVPYISDTGTEVPERCVFGFMLSISAFLGLGTMYVRYKQVQALISASESGLQLLNFTGLLMGIFSTVGMCVVANFQKTDMMSIHLLGAGLTFGPGTLYILVQTGMSYRMQPRFHGRDILWARMAVGMWTLCQYSYTCFASLTEGGSVFISSVLMYDDLPGVDVANKLHWRPGERLVAADLKLQLCGIANGYV